MAAVKPFYLDARLGSLLVIMGAFVAVLDVFLSGCIASGPCQPVPPFPLTIPLGIFATGAAFVLGSIWFSKATIR